MGNAGNSEDMENSQVERQKLWW